MLQIKLDNFTPNSQPRELDNIDLVVAFSYAERTLLQDTSDTTLEFTGDAYAYLKESLETNGYNGVHDIEIQRSLDDGSFGTIYVGKLFISDCEFDLDKRYCGVQLLDAGYRSYIKNNRELETNFTIPRSKNGNTLPTLTPDDVELINPPSNTIPATGINTTTGTTREMYPIQDVLKHFVSFMSDGLIGFDSQHIENIEALSGTKFGIIRGKNLRRGSLGTEVEGQLSFQQLWGDFARLLNMVATIDTSTGSTIMRFEDLEYFQNKTISVRKENVSGIKQSFAQELLYGKIQMGSGQAITDNSVGALSYLPPYDFGLDTYYLSGLANLDSILDANATTLITDSNIIEDVITNNNSGYDENFFLISYKDNAGTYEALTDASDIFNDGNYYYNGEFTNKSVVGRYTLQGAAVKMIGDPDGDFQGRKGSIESNTYVGAPFVGEPYEGVFRVNTGNFDNVIADPSGAWNTGTNTYTASLSGMRNIRVQVDTRLGNDWAFTPPYDRIIPGTNDQVVYHVRVRFKLNGSYIKAAKPTDRNYHLGEDGDAIVLFGYNPVVDPNFVVISENVQMSNTDTLECEIGIGVGKMNIKDLNLFKRSNVIKRSEIPNNRNKVDWFLTNTFITGGDIENLSSTNMVISTQGSINGVPISDEKQSGFFINKFEYVETMDTLEIQSFLNSPQKALFLQNNEHNLGIKAWAYNVSINALTGNTNFQTFNNINEL